MDLDFLGKILPSLIQAGGAGLSSVGNRKLTAAELAQQKQIADDNRAQVARQFDAGMLFDQSKQNQDTAQHGAESVLAQRPIGESQGYAQHQALAQAILGGVNNARATPGDPSVAAAMGSRGGPMSNFSGFDPAMLERLFGNAATGASIAQRDKSVSNVDPNAPTTNFGSLGMNGAQGFQDDVNGYAAGRVANRDTTQANTMQQIQSAIHGPTTPTANAATPTADPNAAFSARLLADPQVQQTMNAGVGADTKKKVINARAQQIGIPIPQGMEFNEHGQLVKHSSSIWGKIGHVASAVAPLALNLIPGVGTAASLALMATKAGVGAATHRGNPLMGAISGVIPGLGR